MGRGKRTSDAGKSGGGATRRVTPPSLVRDEVCAGVEQRTWTFVDVDDGVEQVRLAVLAVEFLLRAGGGVERRTRRRGRGETRPVRTAAEEGDGARGRGLESAFAGKESVDIRRARKPRC